MFVTHGVYNVILVNDLNTSQSPCEDFSLQDHDVAETQEICLLSCYTTEQ